MFSLMVNRLKRFFRLLDVEGLEGGSLRILWGVLWGILEGDASLRRVYGFGRLGFHI